MEILKAAVSFLERTAVVSGGSPVRYGELLCGAMDIASRIQSYPEVNTKPRGSGRGPRVAFMTPPGRHYVESTWGTWLAGGIAVPLCLSHPPAYDYLRIVQDDKKALPPPLRLKELKYVMEDAQVSVVLSSPEYADTVAGLASNAGAAHHVLGSQAVGQNDSAATASVEEAASRSSAEDGCFVIYTSGTTGRPKGALHSHRSIAAQVGGLCSSWEWRAEDRILHTLPLHHIHGIVNALFCAHAVGAAVEFQPKFSPTEVWRALQREIDPVTVFMGVPTMYSYLLSAYEKMSAIEQQAACNAAARLRLTVSGSAACPVPIMQRWEHLSGQRLLERYGMTETGMIVSNPYRGERRPGAVGLPLPGVDLKLLRERPDDPSGELAVRGSNLFSEYWNKPEATAESFTEDGFFMTGDTAAQEGNPPYWRILGRTSTDVIKSGGYKISALQVENALLAHPRISNCAVLGLPHEQLGEQVAAIVTCRGDAVTLEELQTFAAEHLPKYQLPTSLAVLEEIPRNAMGKINKKSLRKEVFPDLF